MIFPAASRESLIRVLIWIGGVLTTMVGAWISSKIHVYYENKKAHLEDLKQKVLLPLSESLTKNYTSLVAHRVPVVADQWGTWHRKENPSVTEYPTEQGPVLLTATPNVIPAIDQALFADARKRHFRKLIQTTQDFLAAWDAHAEECRDWVQKVSDEILAVSGLPKHPA